MIPYIVFILRQPHDTLKHWSLWLQNYELNVAK